MTITSTASSTITRLDSLTGIRTIAVALVFWHHGNEYSDDWASSGMVGVSLFYMLSGFVMAWTDRKGDTARQFYQRRFARIYPSYLVACILAFALLVVVDEFRWSDLAALTLLQAWVPDPSFYFAGNAVFWSLSCEAFFYLIFPLIRGITARLNDRRVALLGGFVVLTSFAIAGIGALFPPTEFVQWAVVVFPPSRLPEFILGVVLGTLMARGWRPSVSLLPTFLLAALAVVVAVFAPYALSRYAVTLLPFALLIVALAAADLRGTPVFTKWRWIVKLGVWSYCFYLIHAMAMWACVKVSVLLGGGELLGILSSFFISIVAAWVLHSFIERPAELRLRPAGRVRLDSDA